MIRLALAALVCALLAYPEQSARPDAQGFIRDWLVLAPIAIDEEMGSLEIERDLIGGEAAIKPSAGEKLSRLGWEWTWRSHAAPDF